MDEEDAVVGDFQELTKSQIPGRLRIYVRVCKWREEGGFLGWWLLLGLCGR